MIVKTNRLTRNNGFTTTKTTFYLTVCILAFYILKNRKFVPIYIYIYTYLDNNSNTNINITANFNEGKCFNNIRNGLNV